MNEELIFEKLNLEVSLSNIHADHMVVGVKLSGDKVHGGRSMIVGGMPVSMFLGS